MATETVLPSVYQHYLDRRELLRRLNSDSELLRPDVLGPLAAAEYIGDGIISLERFIKNELRPTEPTQE